jgi:hypothetical protein
LEKRILQRNHRPIISVNVSSATPGGAEDESSVPPLLAPAAPDAVGPADGPFVAVLAATSAPSATKPATGGGAPTPAPPSLPSLSPDAGTIWGLLILSLAYLHHSTTGFALPALLPIISEDLQLTDSQGALLTAGYTVRCGPPFPAALVSSCLSGNQHPNKQTLEER